MEEFVELGVVHWRPARSFGRWLSLGLCAPATDIRQLLSLDGGLIHLQLLHIFQVPFFTHSFLLIFAVYRLRQRLYFPFVGLLQFDGQVRRFEAILVLSLHQFHACQNPKGRDDLDGGELDGPLQGLQLPVAPDHMGHVLVDSLGHFSTKSFYFQGECFIDRVAFVDDIEVEHAPQEEFGVFFDLDLFVVEKFLLPL